MELRQFLSPNMFASLKGLFEQLNIPVNPISEDPVSPEEILKTTFRESSYSFSLMNDVYVLGVVDNAAFEGNKSIELEKIKSDYNGIVVFGVTLHPRENGLLPTRTTMSDITRAFNREFNYTPVVVVFQYNDSNDETYITFANAERLKYKQEWREGEKAGKVSMLKDIRVANPHRGHLDILQGLKIKRSGKKSVNSFDELYQYWQEVFNVSVLNKKFYKELSNWYFWALNEDKGKVKFPNQPIRAAYKTEKEFSEAIKEHKGKNIIRLLTRILFVWFIKEKGLIPEELFDPKYLKDKLLKKLAPEHEQGNLFALVDLDSYYYKAILQNLFFATLNQEMGKREFRHNKQHQGVTNMMRYQDYFLDANHFIDLVEAKVPFMNGGLFECLDKEPIPDNSHLLDGFSERKANDVQVPDFLFFDSHEVLDLSEDYGKKGKEFKQAQTKGLFRILESYKFTITENTPIEQEIALDPELLGKVFENLLASYNPETKTTARKQTGSFYTPREIVNYMVDESLIAYLKTTLLPEEGNELEQTQLDKQLHLLFSYEVSNPFKKDENFTKEIIHALDQCKILDPACGSGAFPMGVLQKMVHVLEKLDPKNDKWKEVQKKKVLIDTENAFSIEDKNERESRLIEINNAFDEKVNDANYARKLFLIENCIYGVDIQPVATQISKLRFFISLIVDQKVDKSKENFGIRPLPNLETKFVSANTLIGIDKGINLATTKEIETLEKQLKDNRQKIFSAKTPKTKKKYREADKSLRETIAQKLESYGMHPNTAQQLADWNPFDQNSSADFFDVEWMFGIKKGFDVVIGNPPYVFGGSEKISVKEKKYFKSKYKSGSNKINLFAIFIERGISLLKDSNILSYIIPNTFLRVTSYSNIREFVYENTKISEVNDLDVGVFEGVTASTIIIRLKKSIGKEKNNFVVIKKGVESSVFQKVQQNEYNNKGFIFDIFTSREDREILTSMNENSISLGDISRIIRFGVVITKNFDEVVSRNKENDFYKPFLEGEEILAFGINYKGRYLLYKSELLHRSRTPDVFENKKIMIQRITGGAKPIKAAFDNGKYYNKESILNLQLNSKEYDYHYILSLLNSSIINWFYKQKFTNNSKLTVNLSKEYLQQIPIRKSDDRTSLLISTLTKFIETCIDNPKYFTNVFTVLDALILNVYFPDHMSDKQIDIINYIDQDVEDLMLGRQFETLSSIQKEGLLEQFYQKWTHPDNEVRNRIKLFAVRSPDILKPILESK